MPADDPSTDSCSGSAESATPGEHLGRDGVVAGWSPAACLVVVAAALVVLLVVDGFAVGGVYGVALSLLVAGGLAVRLTRLGDDHLVLGADELVVTSSGRTHRWAWADVLEVGVSGFGVFAGTISPGGTVVVRPAGGSWDVPGPNAPVQLLLPVFGRPAARRLRARLRAACEEHGVPFDAQGFRMAEQPRPGSPLRTRPPGGGSADRSPREGRPSPPSSD